MENDLREARRSASSSCTISRWSIWRPMRSAASRPWSDGATSQRPAPARRVHPPGGRDRLHRPARRMGPPQACTPAAKWPEDVKVAVNLSPSQFRKPGLVQIVVSALAVSGLPADRLELEITERVLLKHTKATLETLAQLRDLGVRSRSTTSARATPRSAVCRAFPSTRSRSTARSSRISPPAPARSTSCGRWTPRPRPRHGDHRRGRGDRGKQLKMVRSEGWHRNAGLSLQPAAAGRGDRSTFCVEPQGTHGKEHGKRGLTPSCRATLHCSRPRQMGVTVKVAICRLARGNCLRNRHDCREVVVFRRPPISLSPPSSATPTSASPLEPASASPCRPPPTLTQKRTTRARPRTANGPGRDTRRIGPSCDHVPPCLPARAQRLLRRRDH